ncbi:phosphoenolpyruvate--protein phosphotransferase [Neiella marina]|uniref:phosphoenolpyruvate--protein phosphotransferase n=1 Tax=Neiella marina TaxID=508461 RepID=A0A8J2UAK0_9GAMM|nr:phosphoenolpyruvate--protein phosphotransferase [Neiella marina]GGA89806.1 phosphoenolpyruvate--protein phosphotransferase [Neiella marina]
MTSTTVQQTVSLTAPLSGIVVPLEQVPDPVFAGKMVGDGIAIDPTSQVLLSPCEGTVSTLHPAHHAVSITTANGAEVLMHIGLDTVLLKGDGFTAHVTEGQQVKVGEPLIEFDADQVAQQARSLVTMVLITNPDDFSNFSFAAGKVVSNQDIIIQAGSESAATQNSEEAQDFTAVTSELIALPNPVGLHARPSANLVALAKQFSSKITISCHGNAASARSVVAIMGLNTKQGDEVQLTASGADAEAAIAAISQAIKEGLGEDCQEAPLATAESLPEEQSLLAVTHDDPNCLLGVSASPGSAIGVVVQLQEQTFDYPETAENSEAQVAALHDALDAVQQDLTELQQQMTQQGQADKAEIFQAHQELLSDPELIEQGETFIHRGKSAAFAFNQAIDGQVQVLKQLDNPMLAGRVSDLDDIRNRMLRKLLGLTDDAMAMPENAIIIARDLTPSMTANLDPSKVIGFATTEGGSSSHSAILARGMGIPAVAGIDNQAQQLADGSKVILDGDAGQLRINVSDEEINNIQQRQAKQAEQDQQDLASAHDHAITTDDHQMEVVANIANLNDAEKSVKLGGEGVGLLRSEFLFLDRATAPSEDEQAQQYSAIVKALQGRPIIIRTLDVGGDKPLDYMPMPAEENPFLGERGIRIGLNRPSILRTQVRAILRAAQGSESTVRIMFPMIATLEELQAAKQVVKQEAEQLGVSNYEVGIMVEVPSTAVMAEQFAEEADFFSIGTNDLTQYTLAMDRGHPKLAAQVDGLNPAVLKLIEMTVQGAHKAGKWVGVCGGLASDPQAVPLLLGLGVDELSVSVPALPAIKGQIRELSLSQCQTLAQQALKAGTATAVRQLSPGR